MNIICQITNSTNYKRTFLNFRLSNVLEQFLRNRFEKLLSILKKRSQFWTTIPNFEESFSILKKQTHFWITGSNFEESFSFFEEHLVSILTNQCWFWRVSLDFKKHVWSWRIKLVFEEHFPFLKNISQFWRTFPKFEEPFPILLNYS